MTVLKKKLVLTLACVLLLWAMPGASSAAEEDLAGAWECINASDWTLILHTDGTYTSVFDKEGIRWGISGSWAEEDGRLHFTPKGGLETVLDYILEGDKLTFTDFVTGEGNSLIRMRPKGPSVPPEIIGTWTGEDGGREVFVTLEAAGKIIVAYKAPPVLQGTFAVKDGALDILFTEGSRVKLKYSTVEEGRLILADEKTGAKLRLTRNDFGLPSIFPTPGGDYQYDDWSSVPDAVPTEPPISENVPFVTVPPPVETPTP